VVPDGRRCDSQFTFASLSAAAVEPAMTRLRHDLESGTWHERHQDLLDAEEADDGYRLLIAG